MFQFQPGIHGPPGPGTDRSEFGRDFQNCLCLTLGPDQDRTRTEPPGPGPTCLVRGSLVVLHLVYFRSCLFSNEILSFMFFKYCSLIGPFNDQNFSHRWINTAHFLLTCHVERVSFNMLFNFFNNFSSEKIKNIKIFYFRGDSSVSHHFEFTNYKILKYCWECQPESMLHVDFWRCEHALLVI